MTQNVDRHKIYSRIIYEVMMFWVLDPWKLGTNGCVEFEQDQSQVQFVWYNGHDCCNSHILLESCLGSGRAQYAPFGASVTPLQ